MFFHKKKSKSGEVLQLLESFRNSEGKSRHRVVVSLGNALVPESSWKCISKYVESILYGYRELFDAAEVEQVWIDQILKRIEREGKWQPLVKEKILLGSRQLNEPFDEKKSSEVVDGVLVDEIDHTHETTLGPELVGLKAWEELELNELLGRLGLSGTQCRGATCSVINRLVDPVSEHRLPLWLQTSSLPDVLGEDCLFSGHDKYYKVSDLLYDNRDEIENHLAEKIANHFGFERTYILYDLTNSHFEGECEENAKAKRGRNKQKRHDCPQVVVGVCFDEHGFVLFHKTFAGNMSDSKSLLEMVSAMEACSKESNLFSSQAQPVVIVDAGIATRDNVKMLRANGFSYLVNETRQNRNKYEKYFGEKEEFTPVNKNNNELTVKVRELDLYGGEVEPEEVKSMAREGSCEFPADSSSLLPEDVGKSNGNRTSSQTKDEKEVVKERLVLCRSEPRGAKEEAIFSGAETKFLESLEKLSDRIKKGKLKDTTKIERSIGAIQARYPRASKYYGITYEQTEKEKNPRRKKRTDTQQKPDPPTLGTLVFKRKDQKAQADGAPDPLLGCYVLRTDRCEISAEQLWHLYMTLSKAENGFRVLKSECGLRPNHHQLEHRVDAHIFISILAYQLQRFILYKLELHGDHRSWSTLRRVLQTHSYSTMIVPTRQGITYRIRKPGIPEECQRHIYNQIGVQLDQLPKTKIVVKKNSSTL